MAVDRKACLVRRWLGVWLLGLTLVGSGGTAWAGRACTEETPSPQTMLKATRMAELTLNALDALPETEKVVVIARVGQDLSKYGLEYSHAAFAVRQGQVWNIVHELNTCGTDVSALYDQGMVEFFSDTPFRYRAAVWRLQSNVQERLLVGLAGKMAKRLHHPRYNMLAYPFSTKYQNSNGWLLEMLAFALAPADEVVSREEAQAWLRQSGYLPTQLEIPALVRLGGRMFKANIAFDDHPGELRWNGKIQTVTVDSVAAYLRRVAGCGDPGCKPLELDLGLQ